MYNNQGQNICTATGVGGYPTERPVLMHTWNTFTVHLRQRFGQRVQKIPLDAGASCPNRDGTLSRAGCTFCNAIGSGLGGSALPE